MSSTYYEEIDKLSREDLEAHCRKHQLDSGVDDESAKIVFLKAWELGHSYGNSEVAINYIDMAEIANTVYKNTK